MGKYTSSSASIAYDLPQGTILGPVLFPLGKIFQKYGIFYCYCLFYCNIVIVTQLPLPLKRKDIP